jgi:hypothetical protein
VTKVRKFKPTNPLAKAIGDPNGILVAHALQQASSNLAKVRDAHMAALDGKLSALRVAVGAESRDEELYRLARELLADAGALDLSHLSRAALSLCDLLVSNASSDKLKKGVVVHLEALTALRAAKEDEDLPRREAILQGLVAIAGKKGH